jgi:fermentation-respiration switch protein FrsA (DUF1100 family)
VHRAAALLLLAGLLFLSVRRFESANLYFPDRALTAHPGSYGLAFEELDLLAQDGVRLHGWFIAREPGDPVILFCHGNAGNISNRLQKALIFRRAGASVLLFDYRGYGRSAGRPTEQGTYADAEAAYLFLSEKKNVPKDKIILYGESLGGGVAVETALRREAAGLILDSAFISTAEMARQIFPRLPVRWIISYKYDNLNKIPRLSLPLLVMHSPEDEIVPFAMGKRLFEAARQPKTFFEMKGDHNEGFLLTGEDYGRTVGRFISLTGRNPAPGKP